MRFNPEIDKRGGGTLHIIHGEENEVQNLRMLATQPPSKVFG